MEVSSVGLLWAVISGGWTCFLHTHCIICYRWIDYRICKRLALWKATKWNDRYCKVIGWLRCCICCSLLRSAIACFHGECSSNRLIYSAPLSLNVICLEFTWRPISRLYCLYTGFYSGCLSNTLAISTGLLLFKFVYQRNNTIFCTFFPVVEGKVFAYNPLRRQLCTYITHSKHLSKKCIATYSCSKLGIFFLSLAFYRFMLFF